MTLQEQLEKSQSDLRVKTQVVGELQIENERLEKRVSKLEKLNENLKVQAELKATKESLSEPVVTTEPQVKKSEHKTVITKKPVAVKKSVPKPVVAKTKSFDHEAYKKKRSLAGNGWSDIAKKQK